MPDGSVRCAWLAADRPLVFAHRGGRGLAPENTLVAFDRGLAEGADGLELDIRLSRDGIPVVIHDARVDRTTNASGFVGALTAAELARLDAGCRFTVEGGQPWRGRGVAIPTLGEVLARYPGVPLIVEMKANSPALASAAVAEIRRAGAGDRVCLGSFGLRALAAARRLDDGLATSASQEQVRLAMIRAWLGWPLRRPGYQAFIVPERRQGLTVVTPRFVQAARRAGLGVYVWTVDCPEDACRLLDWGVSGILTDRPDVTVRAVRDWMQASDLAATARERDSAWLC